jgi:hypothetical protein
MGQNSFLIKGWTVTLVSALFALAAKDSSAIYVLVAYFPTAAFWFLDSYYLYQERLFRKVYDSARGQNSPVDFSLSTKSFDKGLSDWLKALFSITILIFYGVVIMTLIIVMYIIN